MNCGRCEPGPSRTAARSEIRVAEAQLRGWVDGMLTTVLIEIGLPDDKPGSGGEQPP
jgi:hypothetical protein